MVTTEFKIKIATKKNVTPKEVKCINCKYWGYNNGLSMNSVGNSKCKSLRKNTFALDFCRGFEKNS